MSDIKFSKIRPRRGTAADWTLYNTILAEGEIGVEYPDSGIGSGEVKIKFGDGITPWNRLAYGINPTFAHAIHGGTPTVSNDIWLRSGTYNEWIAVDPVLGDGEIVYDKTNNALIVGDGIHRITELSYTKASELIGGGGGDVNFDFGDEDDPSPSPGDLYYDFGDEDETL